MRGETGERARVRILGPPGAEVGGRPVDLGGAQRRSLLVRLAVAAGATVGTDRLVDDLWRGEPPPRALAGLQAHVSHLRRALEPGRGPRTPATVLVSEAPGYALRVGADLDATRAAELVRRARGEEPAEAAVTLREALGLWRGPSLGEFAEERWALDEAERLDELRRGATEALAAAELALAGGGARAAAAVVDLLAPHVREHPLREEAVRLLATALYRCGRQADALAGIDAARRRLADDLGLDASRALDDLAGDILRQDPRLDAPGEGAAAVAPAAGRTARSLASPVPDVPFARPGDGGGDGGDGAVLGRDRELGRLEAACTRAAAGPGELLLLTGEAGAGKSTLLDELARRRLAQGWSVLRGRCPEVDGSPPGWAWTEVGDALGTRVGGEGAFLAGRALVDALRGAGRPVLVALDDLHRGDDETLRLLRVVVSAAVPGVLVVGTYRHQEVHDELEATVASLAAATGDRLELTGLDAAGCARLLGRHGLDVDADGARRAAERTGGNPLFLREVARLAATVGREAAGDVVPAGVRDVLRRRVAQLPAAAGAVLRRAAVLGRTVDVDVLVALEQEGASRAVDTADPDLVEDRVLTALEAALVTGLAVGEGPRSVRFAHDLVREVLYADVPALRRGRAHADVLGVLERLRPRDAAALARHALAAGPAAGTDRVLDHVVTAAVAARRAGSPRGAADLLAAGLTAAPDAGPARRLELRTALASALAHAGATVPALAQRTAALAEARAHGGDAALLAAVTCLDGPVSFSLAVDAALDRDVVDTAGALLATDPAPPARLRLLATRAFAWHPREPELCLADADAAVALVDALDRADPATPGLRCLAVNARFWSDLTPERWDSLDEVGRELLAAADAAGSWGHRAVGHHARLLHACFRLDLDAADAHARAALAEAPDGQLGAVIAWSRVFAGLRSAIAGRLEEAEALSAALAAALADRGVANAGELHLAALLGIRHAQGRLGELVDPVGQVALFDADLAADPYAWVLLAAGRHDDARAVWRPHVPVRRDWWWLLWTAMRADVAIALDDAEVARACHAALTPWSGHLAGAMSGTATLGPVDHVLARLARFLGRPAAEREAHLAAATALCERLGASHWAAMVDAER